MSIFLVILLALGGLLIFHLLSIVFGRQPGASSDLPLSRDPARLYDVSDEQEDEILDRIFASEDWHFLSGRASAEAEQAFLAERKQIAMCWISLRENQAKLALHNHVSGARKFKEVQPLLECKIALSYLLFRLNCAVLRAIVSLRGPFGLQRTVVRASRIYDRLRGMSGTRARAGELAQEGRGR